MWEWLDYVIVVVAGALVGASELVARYRDAPTRALRNTPALFYVGVNALAALLALLVTRIFNWDFGFTDPDQVRVTQVLVAGLGAMALFRSALFTVRVGDKDVAVGPISLLQIILTAADAGVDRRRADARAADSPKVMEGISYGRAGEALPRFCAALMQNFSEADLKALSRELNELKQDSRISDVVKAQILGVTLMNYFGRDVLESAVAALGNELRPLPEDPSSAAATHARERKKEEGPRA